MPRSIRLYPLAFLLAAIGIGLTPTRSDAQYFGRNKVQYDKLDFRILRIEPESKKIGLSHRAAKHDEPIVDVKSYTTDAGGGMASLGELADFFNKRGGPEGEENR